MKGREGVFQQDCHIAGKKEVKKNILINTLKRLTLSYT